MLEKESINLPEIISVIGDRPFEMKESIRNYLNEMKTRETDAAEKKDTDFDADAEEESSEEQKKESDEKS